MTSEKRAQKFHADDASLSRSDWLNKISHAAQPIRNQKHYSDLGSNVTSVRNFCACFSDVISRGNVGCFFRLCKFAFHKMKQLFKREKGKVVNRSSFLHLLVNQSIHTTKFKEQYLLCFRLVDTSPSVRPVTGGFLTSTEGKGICK